MQKNILITGKPKSGKSTLLGKLIETIEPKVGLVTKEIRENSERIAFEIETSKGERVILSDSRIETPHKVSRYFVNISNLESMLPNVASFNAGDLLYLDEIGQMQLLSDKFKEFVLAYLDAPNTCLATISYIYEDEFTKKLKERDDVILVEISEEDREEKEIFISQLLRKIEKAKGYIKNPERFTKKGSNIELRSKHGVRTLSLVEGKWQCDCDFHKKYEICSHAIAIKELSL